MVTIRDLCETNPSIVDIEIDLRSSTGQLEHTYRIGGGAQYYPGDNVPWRLGQGGSGIKRDHIDVVRCELNTYEYKDQFGFRPNGIPRAYRWLLELPVTSWKTSSAYRYGENRYNFAQKMHVHIFRDESAAELEAKQNVDEAAVIEGQVSIMDFLKGDK